MFNIEAKIIAIGVSEQYRQFFEVGVETLSKNLEKMGIGCKSDIITTNTIVNFAKSLQQATENYPLILLLVSPEAKAYESVSSMLSKGLNLEVSPNPVAVQTIAEYCIRTGTMINSEDGQSFSTIPSGVPVIPNPNGLVQGYAVEAQRQTLVVLPCMPSELQTAMEQYGNGYAQKFATVNPQAVSAQNEGVINVTANSTVIVKAAEIGNSAVFPRLKPILESTPEMSCHYSNGDYRITIDVSGVPKEQVSNKIKLHLKNLTDNIGDCIYASEDKTLDEIAVAELAKQQMSISIGESGTKGYLTNVMLTNGKVDRVLKKSNTFCGKDRLFLLNIPDAKLKHYGVASTVVASHVAKAVQKNTSTTLGVGLIYGVCKETGQLSCYIAMTDGGFLWNKTIVITENDSERLIHNAVMHTINMMRLYASKNSMMIQSAVPIRPDIQRAEPAPVKSLGSTAPAPSNAPPAARGYSKVAEATAPAAVGFGEKVKAATRSKAMGATESPKAATGNNGSLIQRVADKNLNKNDIIRLVALAICVTVFLGCIYYIVDVYAQADKNKALNQTLQDIIALNKDVTEVPEHMRDYYPAFYQAKFAELYEQNPDIVGTLYIEGTMVNYPVVQSSDNLYYERRDFLRQDNSHGVPFLDFRVGVHYNSVSRNSIIYGHNMTDGQMFGELINYKTMDFYREHPIIEYDTVYHDGDYKIFGVVIAKKDDPDFDYHNFVEFYDEDDFMEYVEDIRERSLINTKVDVVQGDELLTLSTCDYVFGSQSDPIARFVVFARKVREGESMDVDVMGASVNPNPVMPAEWYDQLAKEQAAALEQQAAEDAANNAYASWLYDSEMISLSATQQMELVNERKALAETYLTYDERENWSVDDKLYWCGIREAEFAMYLLAEDSSLSVVRKIAVVTERKALANMWLSSSEISNAKTWTNISALIEEKESAQGDDGKWLYPEEMLELTGTTRDNLIATRKAMAEDAGLSDSQINNTATWAEMEVLISNMTNAKELADYIEANRKWISTSDENNTLTALKALVATRTQMAIDAGVNASGYSTWTEIENAINVAGQAQITTLMASNKPWVNSSDSSKTYSAIESLIATNKKYVTDKGYATSLFSSCISWDETLIMVQKLDDENTAANEITTYVSQNQVWFEIGETFTTLDLAKAKQAERQIIAGDLNVSSYSNWSQVTAAIAANSASAAATAAANFVSENPGWFNNGETYTNLAEAEAVYNERKALADLWKVSPGYDWTETNNLIQAAITASSSSSSSSESSSSESSSSDSSSGDGDSSGSTDDTGNSDG